MGAGATVTFDPFDVAQMVDPYPSYRSLRDESPVHYFDLDDLWAVSRYDDCVAVLRDPATFSSKDGMSKLMEGGLGRRAAARPRSALDPLQYLTDLRVLIAIDPPDHVRLRRLLSRPFTPREIGVREEWIRPLCQDTFTDLLRAAAEGRADWVRDFTWPFPVMVISELLGIPKSLREDFKRWSDDLVGTLGGLGMDLERSVVSFMEMLSFFHEAIATRTAEPTDDLISMLIHNAAADDEPLTADELVLFCVLLLVAGNETTTNLLSNGMKVFASDPALYERMRKSPELIPAAVEEVLRFDAPVQALPRGTTRSVDLHGVTIPAGATVLVFFGAANRDDRHFANPETFDLDRAPNDHLGFGSGIHLCLGAPLARLEAAIALETLVQEASALELVSAPVPTEGTLLRGARSMPIEVVTA